MNTDERQRDEELAAFTDALLESQAEPGAAPCAREESQPPLAETVRMLARALHPQPPPDSLHRAVRRQIIAGWAAPRPSFWRRLLRPAGRPIRRWQWVLAPVAVLAALALAIVLLAPGGGEPVLGTIPPRPGTMVLIVAALVGLLLIVAWLIARRRR